MYLYSLFNLGARWGGWSTPRSGRFAPWKDPVPIVNDPGCDPVQVWTVAGNIVSTAIRSPVSSSCVVLCRNRNVVRMKCGTLLR